METVLTDHIDILLIDDDADDVLLTQRLLSDVDGLEAELSWVSTYEEGLSELLSERFDVCLVDYRLGGRDGVQLLREAARRGCTTPVILLTGQGGREVDLQAMQAGAADYLVKGRTNVSQFERSIRYARERKIAEERLRESERRYRAVFNATFQFMAVVNTDGVVVEVNQTALDLGELKREQVVGRPFWACGWWEDMPDEARRCRKALEGAASGEAVRYETQIRDASGRRIPVEFAVKGAPDRRGRVALLVAEAHDLSRQKEAQEKIQTLNRQLEERVRERTAQLEQNNELLTRARDEAEAANRAKSSFLANMSHDIRTPLTSIIGYSDVLAETGSSQDREIGRLIRSSSQRLMHTLESVLDLARLDGRDYQLNVVPLNLCEEVSDVVQIFLSQASSRGIALEMSSTQTEIWAQLDRAALSRVLTNLIGNALKFTDEGAVYVEVEAQNGEALIRVRDTGIGISEEFLPRIFDVFQQERRGQTMGRDGSGLGLAIASQLVSIMNGSLSVQSEAGVGTTFEISFPTTELPPSKDVPDQDGDAVRAADGGRLLIVEDNSDARRLFHRLIGDEFELDEARNAEEALSLLEEREYSVLIVDINLGKGRTGVDLVRTVRANPEYEDLPMLACTALALPGSREELLQMGFDDYLSKPFSRKQLRQSLSRLLQQ